MIDNPVSFAADISHLFRDSDIRAMRRVRGLDLASYDEVSRRADDILARLKAGDMPCDSPWPENQVALFEKWISDGKLA